MDNIMCLVDFALKRSHLDGNYPIRKNEFELLMWKFRMMSIDKQAGLRIVSPTPPRQWLESERKRSMRTNKRAQPLLPERMNLQGLDRRRSLAGELSSSQTADMYNKLRSRRRGAHSQWAKEKFRQLDLDGNGNLSRLELGTASFADCIRECLGEAQHLPGLKYLKSLVNFVLGKADADGDNNLSLKEFESFTWKVKNMQSDIDFETEFLFQIFDPDRNGKLDLEEFAQMFNFHSGGGGQVSSKQYIKDVMAELDQDGDGSISLSEYRSWHRQSSQSTLGSEEEGNYSASLKSAQLLDPEVRRRDHKDWAAIKFACLDPPPARGYLTRKDLCTDQFLCVLQEILPKYAVEINIIMPLVDFVMGQHEGGEQDYHISSEQFEVLLWKIEKLDMKSWTMRPNDEDLRQVSDDEDGSSEASGGSNRSRSSSRSRSESHSRSERSQSPSIGIVPVITIPPSPVGRKSVNFQDGYREA
jgi:Ca2+-binding EF-hand superfamily protein